MGNGIWVMDEHIGNKLPNPVLLHHRQRDHGKAGNKLRVSEKKLGNVNQYVYPDEYKHNVVVSIAERSSYDVHLTGYTAFSP